MECLVTVHWQFRKEDESGVSDGTAFKRICEPTAIKQ